MKSVVKEIKKSESPSFPCLKRCTSSGHESMIVLFNSDEAGTVVSTETSTYPLGYFSKTWESDNFVPFSGEVILSEP